ncbi:MAG: hypothetical protein LBL35_08700 [Clostridiales bacterium]|jgi:hypothetical protein|nr:hypothetical protein [Clostridiales bacterium]
MTRKPARLILVFCPALILTFLLTSGAAFANDSSPFFYVALRYEKERFERKIMLFSDCELDECSGEITLIFSDAAVKNGFDGKMTAIFSRVDAKSGSVSATSFSSYFTGDDLNVSHVFKALRKSGSGYVDDSIPLFMFGVLRFVLFFSICFCVFPIRKSFFEQCAAAFIDKPFNAVKAGAAAHILLAGLTILFIMSVIGFPIALIIAFFCVVFFIAGEIGLGIAVGHLVFKLLRMKSGDYARLIVGVSVVEGLALPLNVFSYAGQTVIFLALPTLAYGVALMGLYNKYITKKLYAFV